MLFRVSGLNTIPTFEESRIGKVSRKDGSPSERGVPEYLVEPVEYKFDKRDILDDIQLVDFGECMSSLT